MSSSRQLAAIMFTDIEGYTSLMNRDEEEGIELRIKHRKAFESTTEAYHGTVVQYFGDGTLSIFKSTVEDIDCAIELQKVYLGLDIPVRIGIHVGDIVLSNDDIIGDAVNVASRIESGAIPGSILISDKVHDQVRNHRHIQTVFFRLSKPDYKKAIKPLQELVAKDQNYLRILGYSYGQIGDTAAAYRVIDSIRQLPFGRMTNHRIAVVFAGMDIKDSVFYYLDSARNKSNFFDHHTLYYFDSIKKDPRYNNLLKQHKLLE